MAQGMKQILSQQLRMTPQQVLLSSLLQLPIQALEQRLKQELEQNPLLEETQEIEEELEEEVDLAEEAKIEQLQQKEDEEKKAEEEIKALEDKEKRDEEEVDWQQILNDDNHYEVRAPRDPNPEDDEDHWVVPAKSSLSDHLLEQLRFTDLDTEERRIGEYIIWNLNEDGYLVYDEQPTVDQTSVEIRSFIEASASIEPSVTETEVSSTNVGEKELDDGGRRVRHPKRVIDPVEAIAQEVACDASKVERVLKVVQSLDPAGIAARNLRECILIQLRRREQGYYDEGTATSIRIVGEAYDDFINRRYDRVARQLKISLDDIKASIAEILRLNPKPGEGYFMPEQNYVTPDVVIKKVDDKFEIALNDFNVPRLRINHAYKQMLLQKDPGKKETKEFIKNKLESAKWLINSIYRRRDTIYRTVEAIVDLQKDFFEKGKEFIRPMKLEDVATRIAMDISTVSRATNGKYAQTDYGVFELKYFFSTGLTSSDGEDVSTKQIKAALRDIIAEEDKHNPLSDDELAQIMTERGNPIARRTVAKYREQLRIAPARLRKEI